jgi:hypothetical protein
MKKVFRRIFEPKRDNMTGGWRKLHNEELHSLYFSLNIISMNKSRRIRWEEHDGIGGRIILKWILRK